MRAPFQEGDFPGPVKYGYLNVGVVEDGPAELRGRTVFCLLPAPDAYVVPGAARSTVVPDDVPPRRAVLAGTVETAVNALWDAAPLVGDRVAVVGAGMVGCCVARLLARIPGVEVTLVDVDPAGADVAAALGVGFALPGRRRRRAATSSCTPAPPRPGCSASLDLLAPEGTVLDLSWYGDAAGRALARRRLPLRPARHPGQPGRHGVAGPARQPHAPPTGWRSRWTCCATRRSTRCSPASRASRELPDVMRRLAAGDLPALCHTITYDEE